MTPARHTGPDRRDPAHQHDNPGPRRREADLGEIVEQAETKLRPWVKMWAAVAVVGTGLGSWGILRWPLETVAAADAAHNTLQTNINQNAADIAQVKGRVDRIDENTAKSLRLQLRRFIRDLQSSIAGEKADSPARRQLEQTLDQAQADLDDIERQLGAR